VLLSEPACCRNANGRLEVFVRWVPTDTLQHRWQQRPGGPWS
jgi:hypothetical protein